MSSQKKSGTDTAAGCLGALFVLAVALVFIGGWSLLMAYAARYVLGIFHVNVTLWQAYVVWFVLTSLFAAGKSLSTKKE